MTVCVCFIWLDMTTPPWCRDKVMVYYYLLRSICILFHGFIMYEQFKIEFSGTLPNWCSIVCCRHKSAHMAVMRHHWSYCVTLSAVLRRWDHYILLLQQWAINSDIISYLLQPQGYTTCSLFGQLKWWLVAAWIDLLVLKYVFLFDCCCYLQVFVTIRFPL